jgi:hypothetical protein
VNESCAWQLRPTDWKTPTFFHSVITFLRFETCFESVLKKSFEKCFRLKCFGMMLKDMCERILKMQVICFRVWVFLSLLLFFKQDYCGDCVQKLFLACDVRNHAHRYRLMQQFFQRQGLQQDADFVSKILSKLE